MTPDPVPGMRAHDVYERGPAGLWVGKDMTAGPVAPEPPAPRTQLVEVDCPQCGNLNRRARRACRHCGRTGRVTKRVPTPEAEARTMFQRTLRQVTAADQDGLGHDMALVSAVASNCAECDWAVPDDEIEPNADEIQRWLTEHDPYQAGLSRISIAAVLKARDALLKGN